MATDFSVLLLLANFFVVDSSSSSLVVTPNVIYAEEGGSASYTVALGSQPTGLVKVRVSSSNSTLVDVVSSPIFSESNWSTPVSIVVAASDDAWGAFEEHDVELTNSCVGCDDVFVRLVIFDDDACVRNCQPGFHSTSCNMTRSCVPCPIGYTCAGGCETPTPCEAGKFAAQSGTADQCATCPSGTFTTEYGSSSCFECTAGYHCSDPSTPKACPAGMTSAARSIECTNCTAGRYARLEGQTTCESCPAGFECQNTYEATPCDPGTFSEGNQTKCSACPAGYACSSTGASPRVCADGSYSLTNWQYCVVCPPGHYCINVAYPPTKCAAGTFTAAGNATHCDTCPVGRYTGNVTGSATCILCPRGYSCYDPTVEPIACENGTFSELGNAICDACELGRYSHAASDVCHPCPEGYSCPRPSENPVACTQGKYSTSSDVSCSPCDVGRLSASDHTRCEDCPAGFQCPDPANGAVPCGQGFYSQSGTNFACNICPLGHMCPDSAEEPVMCETGYFASFGQVNCTECPEGYSCLDPRDPPSACGIGNYSQAGAAGCLKCPDGYTCEDGRLAEEKCPMGTFSDSDNTGCAFCPSGYGCQGGIALQCAQGTYAVGNASSCLLCPAGSYCPSQRSLPVACPPATWSFQGAVNCTSCAPGRKPNADRTGCDNCDVGHYCPFDHIELQLPCPAGTYSEGGQALCTPCPAGFECPSTSAEPAASDRCQWGTFSDGGEEACHSCPSGMECASGDTSKRRPCPLGTYSLQGDSECNGCPSGYFCRTPVDVPSPCDVGTYSLANQSSCAICPAGFACEDSSMPPVACSEGTYSTGGATLCTDCKPGYMCPNASMSASPAGHECMPGTFCNPAHEMAYCPPGTFGNTSAGRSVDHACTPCLPGYYCPIDGLTFATVRTCPNGTFCPARSIFPTACPSGTYQPVQGATTEASCRLCPSGYFCPQNSSSYSENSCEPGYVCPAGTEAGDRVPCPAGTYSNRTGLKRISQCRNCTVGHYCPQASVNPRRCQPGTYNPLKRAVDIANCRECLAGWACESSAMYAMTTPCAPGHYCPPGTLFAAQNPCPAGYFTNFTNLTSMNQCLECPAGYACWRGAVQPSMDCSPGYYCEPGTSPSTMTPCPAGTFSSSSNLKAASDCTKCNSSFYCSGGSAEVTGICPRGRYCPLGSSSGIECPAGTYGASSGLSYEHECTPCAPGKFCVSGSTSPTDCPSGTFSPNRNTKSAGPLSCMLSDDCYEESDFCFECPAGYRCPEGSSNPIPCGVGNYSSSSSATCDVCEPGHYCGSNTTDAVDMYTLGGNWDDSRSLAGRCFNGTYCPAGMMRAPDLLRNPCPSGHYCPEATDQPIECPAGRYMPVTGADDAFDCLLTPRGHYTTQGQNNYTLQLCNPGYYCPLGSTSPTEVPCPERYYLPDFGGGSISDCSLCIAGGAVRISDVVDWNFTGYCPNASATPTECPAGYFCTTGSSRPEPCRPGTYSNRTAIKRSEDCKDCTSGYYCDGYGLTRPRGPCDPGYFCLTKSYTSAPHAPGSTLSQLSDISAIGGLCPSGGAWNVRSGDYSRSGYCPQGSSEPSPPGTYNNYTGATSPSDCKSCDPGFYCSGSRNPHPSGECQPGFYCTGGANSSTQYKVPKGHFSIQGASAPSPCVPGKYQPFIGQSLCLACPPGQYCSNFNTSLPLVCPEGSYCEEGTVNPEKCPARDFYVSILTSIVCRPVPTELALDSTPPYTAKSARQGLSASKLVSQSRLQKLAPLVSGKLTSSCDQSYGRCGEGSSRERPIDQFNAENEKNGDICPKGHTCPRGGENNPIPCPIGSYYPGEGSNSSCVSCPPGFACNTTGTVEPKLLCAEGYFCSNGAESATPDFGGGGPACTGDESAWEQCTYGPCPAGYECPEGTGEPALCLPGKYAPIPSMAACLECPASQYCDGIETTVTFDCPLGHFCPAGTGIPQPKCPEGSFGATTNLSSVAECLVCTEGSYCSRRGLHEPDGACFEGYYCPSNSSTGRGLSGGNEHRCPTGTYCPMGTGAPISCPDGTFGPSEGLVSRSDCLNCTAGYYCEASNSGGGGLSAPSGMCDAGYFCQSGSSNPRETICPAGSYCPLGSVVSVKCSAGSYAPVNGLSECFECPSGFWCSVGTITPKICSAGYYCPNGTISANENPCPQGTWSNQTGNEALGDCRAAAPGSYALAVGNTHLDGLCDAGYYCLSGSSTPTPTEPSMGGICGPGYNCPEGSASKANCPGGYACTDGTGVTGPCKAGYWCSRNSYTATPDSVVDENGALVADECPAGHYCEEGTAEPIPCPPGTFATARGLTDASDCAFCLGGWLCPNNATDRLTQKCPAGYFCGIGTIVSPVECPLGHFCDVGVAEPSPCLPGTYQDTTKQSNCLECPERYYCELAAESYVACPPGHYCPSGTGLRRQFPCPRGSYNNRTGLAAETECEPCSPGSYCETAGLSAPTGECAEGFFCFSGAKTAVPRSDSDYLKYGI